MKEPRASLMPTNHTRANCQHTSLVIRRGDRSDAPAVLTMFDLTVEWLVANNRQDQWGTEPWSADPRKVERVNQLIADGDLWIAELAGRVAGALIVSEQAMPYVPPAAERELYVQLLFTDPAVRGHRVGATLLDQARAEARQRAIALLRVDCFAGGDGRLVRYYESQGFTRVAPFEVKGWPGQLLEQRDFCSDRPRADQRFPLLRIP